MKDYIDMLNKIHSLEKEITIIKFSILERHEIEIENLWKNIENPKRIYSPGEFIPIPTSASSSNVFTRVIISIIITASLALFTFVGDILYLSPSPDQTKVIKTMLTEVKYHRLKQSS